WDCSRIRVKIDEERFEPTQKFLDETDRILSLPLEEQYDQFQILHTIYGHKIATEVILGGQMFHTDLQEKNSSVDESVHKGKLQAAFSLAVTKVPVTFNLGMEIRAGAGGGSLNENRTRNEDDDQKINLTFKATGGNTLLCQDPGKWIATVADYCNWRVIKIEKLESLYKVLDKERQQKVELALQHHNRAIVTCDRPVDDSPDIVKLEITLTASNTQLSDQMYKLLRTVYPLIAILPDAVGAGFVHDTKLSYYAQAPSILDFIERIKMATNSPHLILDIFLSQWKELSDDAIALIAQALQGGNKKIETNIHISSDNHILTKTDWMFCINSQFENKKAMHAVWKLLSLRNAFKAVICSGIKCHLQTDVISTFSKALETNNTVQTLNLSLDYFGDELIIALAQSLKVNKTLKKLSANLGLDSNTSEKSLLAIANMLQINRTLTL
ncbi:unnamed protein product, partial [Rotaria sp. Silwood1]